jgi:hypothetical protein
LSSTAHGQLTTATVSGTVTDASGAAIPSASLRLENVSRAVAREAVSGTDGRFSFDFVAVGTYRLTVSQSGFNTTVRSGLELSAGQVVDMPIQLEIQQQTQTVEVAAEAAALDTTTAEQVAALNSSQVHDLPVAHLDWSNLLADSTGATKPPAVTTLNSTSPGGSGVNINGLPSAGYNFTVDGTNASNNTVFTAFNVYQGVSLINTVNNDSIEEVSTARGTPPASVGGGMSGNINIVTRGGTNQYHGSVHELNEVSVFDARNQFLAVRPRTTFNDYGGSIGLPVLKNKLFFFGSYEGAKLTTSKAITGGVPSPYLIGIAPAEYAPLFALFPKAPQPANAIATTSQYFGAGSNSQKDANGVYRFDYYINSSNIIAVRYIRSRPTANSPAILAANPRNYFDKGDAANVSYTRSSAHWTENTRVALNVVNMDRVDALLSDPNFGNVTFGWSSAGSKDLHWWGNYATLQEAVAYVHGRQTIQFGGIVERTRALEVQITPTSISYASLSQFLSNTPNSFTLALHSFPAGQQPWTNTRFQYGEYFQDDVRLTKELTLNLGVRYDIFTVPVEIQNRVFNRYIDPNNPQLGPGFGPIVHQFFNPDHTQFQPRVGLAYNLFGRGLTVLRAGFAKMSMGPTFYETVTEDYQLGPSLPFAVSMNQAQTQASGLKYPFNATGYVAELTQLQGAGVISSNLPVTAAINLHFPDPYSLQWMFGIQQTLPWGMTLEAAYNGNRGLHENFAETLNQPNRVTGVAPVANFGKILLLTDDDRSKYAALQVNIRKRLQRGLLFAWGLTWARVSAFGAAENLEQSAPQDPYNFHADYGPAPFDIRVRSVTHAIWDVPLTKWTRTTGRAANLLLDGWQISGVFSAQTGLPANVTNAASANGTDRPDAAGGGISPYLSGYRTGIHQYLNPAAFTTIPISALSGEQIRTGNLSNEAVRIPGLENLDLTLAKSFPVTERVHLQVRADTFNTLNHTNLSGLVTTINNTSTFGQLTTATARTMQLGARLSF